MIRRFARSVDVLFMRLPFQVPTALRRLGKPKLMHIVSNQQTVIEASSDYSPIMKQLARRFAGHFAGHDAAAWRPSPLHARRLERPAKCTTCCDRVLAGWWSRRASTNARCGRAASLGLSDPPRLLFVGYLRPEKGVDTLLDAFDSLHRRRPLKLTLVGGVDKTATHAEAATRARIAASPYRRDIELRGIVEFGETLFDLYRSHDVFLQPSLSEGTPRTLVEARSFGCPVIATRSRRHPVVG